jgi:hypothetical protein
MKLSELIECLGDLRDGDDELPDVDVTFGPSFDPVDGGSVQNWQGVKVLNLSVEPRSGRPNAF